MNTHDILLDAALKVLEEDGEAQFSTRKVCAIANVTAPTLYHHYGSADGLLSAAMAEAFGQFLESKKAVVRSADPVAVLREGWNDYVRFAATRPRLYAAMMSRVLDGADIPAAEQAFALLLARIAAIAAKGRLRPTVAAAADLMGAVIVRQLCGPTVNGTTSSPGTPSVQEDVTPGPITTASNGDTSSSITLPAFGSSAFRAMLLASPPYGSLLLALLQNSASVGPYIPSGRFSFVPP